MKAAVPVHRPVEIHQVPKMELNSTAHDVEPKLNSSAERSRLRDILSTALAILAEDHESSEHLKSSLRLKLLTLR